MKTFALLWLLVPIQALAQAAPDATGWLKKIHQASQKLSYSGTFVYRQGDRIESSRIVRLIDASGDTEKLEALDGVRREVVRTDGEVKCYLPDSMVVQVDRRSDLRSFPALLPAQISTLSEQYQIAKGGLARIAGYDCQEIVLTPKDDLRYGYRLWADTGSGMLLKARIFNEKGEMIEEFRFTQLTIGQNIDREKLKPSFSGQDKRWRIENSAVQAANLADAGWTLTPTIPGFHKVIEIQRKMRESQRVGQIVYSDGLAAVSVFIEPMEPRPEPVRAGFSNMGAVNIYTRELANHIVTVIGEVPAMTVRRIANTVEFHRPR